MEFETNKKSKSTGVLVVIIILLLGCVGFLGYKLYFEGNNANNTTPTQNNNTTTVPGNNTTTTPVTDPKEDDENVTVTVEEMTISQVKKVLEGSLDANVKIVTPKVTEKELKTDFKNLDKSNNGYDIVVSCTYYNKSEKNCETYSVTVNSKINYKLSLPGCTSEAKLYAYNNYLVLVETEGCGGSANIRIFDSNNNEVYESSGAYSFVYDLNDEDYNEIYLNPTITSKTLYFVKDINDDGKMYLVSIDLSKSTVKEKTIGEFTATHIH